MEWLTRIGRTAGLVLAFLMRVAGLVSAIDLLLVHPERATAPDVLLSGLLLLGGQAAKDLILGVVDRLLVVPHHPPVESEHQVIESERPK